MEDEEDLEGLSKKERTFRLHEEMQIFDEEEEGVGLLIVIFLFVLLLLILAQMGYLHLTEFLRAIKRTIADLFGWVV